MQIFYRAYHAPFPVSPREFVALNGLSEEADGTLISYGSSINYPDAPHNPKYVRGNVMVTGFIVRPVASRGPECEVTRITQIDPKGQIPPFVSNLAQKRSGVLFENMRYVVFL